jgi:NAD+ synthase
MNAKAVKQIIIEWLKAELKKRKQMGFVVGVSGGVDSALVSTLCAETGEPVLLLSLPILQEEVQLKRANEHMLLLKEFHSNVEYKTVDLTSTFNVSMNTLEDLKEDFLVQANLRARLRMVTLYAHAGHRRYLVAGTGNKVEDQKVMFFTKWGDGACDLSPIGDLLKTHVWELSKFLGINEAIIKAKPTDGLWPDNRGDEDAIGASYPELEEAISFCFKYNICLEKVNTDKILEKFYLTDREKNAIRIYAKRNIQGRHKIEPIPICIIPKDIL